MKLTVKNLGPIEEATIDLSKDLIVLTGQNNTGKTYLTNLICGVSDVNITSTIVNVIIDTVERQIPDIINPMIIIDLEKELPKLISEELRISLSNIFSSNNKSILYSQVICKFNKKDQQYINKAFQYAKSFGYMKDNEVWDKNPFGQEIILSTTLSEYNNLEFKINFNEGSFKDFKDFLQSYLTAGFDYFADSFFPSIKCFSSERQGVTLFHRDLTYINSKSYEQLIKAKDIFEVRKLLANRISRFPAIIRSNIEMIQKYETEKNKKSDYSFLANELEDGLLPGKIVLNEFGDIQLIPEKSKQSLDIQLTSSSVKSLSTLAIYLKHSAKKGDTIIIDEPELNLHPDSQRKVARFLGRLVNEGFKVIISTHSDYIIKELNNMIMLSSANGQQEDLLKRLGYSKNQLLKHNQVEAHLFTLANSKPEKIKIDETGFSVETIDEVIEQLDSDTEKIYYQLFEQENKT